MRPRAPPPPETPDRTGFAINGDPHVGPLGGCRGLPMPERLQLAGRLRGGRIVRVLSRMARPRLLDTPQLPEGLLVQWCGERALLSKSGGRMHSACTRCSCWNHPPSHRFFTSPKRFTRCSLTSLPSVHTLFCVAHLHLIFTCANALSLLLLCWCSGGGSG